MSLTNPGRALGRSSLLSNSRKLLTPSGIPPFSINSFRLPSLLALLVGLNLSFLIGTLAWFFKITKVVCFESVEVFCRDPFLALYFSLTSLIISRLLCLLPSAALFTLIIWPFGPPHPRSPLRWRPHKKLCFDWSAGLSTGVFLSIRANVRPPSCQWIPTKLTSSPSCSYSAPASVSIPLRLFLKSPSIALFSFLNIHYFKHTLISRIHSSLFSNWRRAVSFKFFDTQVSSIFTEVLVLPRHARCVLSRLRCNGNRLLLSFYLFGIGRIENPSITNKQICIKK